MLALLTPRSQESHRMTHYSVGHRPAVRTSLLAVALLAGLTLALRAAT